MEVHADAGNKVRVGDEHAAERNGVRVLLFNRFAAVCGVNAPAVIIGPSNLGRNSCALFKAFSLRCSARPISEARPSIR